MRKLIAASAAALCLATASPAIARDAASGVFSLREVPAVLRLIEEGCVARGFEIRTTTSTTVTCTAAGLENRSGVDLLAMPVGSNAARTNITFTAVEITDGVAVSASITQELRRVRGEIFTINADGRAFFRYKSRVRIFLTAIGAADVR